MTDPTELPDTLQTILRVAEKETRDRHESLAQEAGRHAACVGPLATAHHLAQLAEEMFNLFRANEARALKEGY